MSIQTNFRAEDMLGIPKPEVKKSAPRYVAPAPVVEPVVVVEPVAVVEDVVREEETSEAE